MSLYSNLQDLTNSVKLALTKKADKIDINRLNSLIADINKKYNALAKVAKTGEYNDLKNLPSLALIALTGSYYDLSNKPNLSTVATTGNYNDLINIPTDLVHIEDVEEVVQQAISDYDPIYIGADRPQNGEKVWYKLNGGSYPLMNELDIGDYLTIKTKGYSSESPYGNYYWVCFEKDTVNNTVSLINPVYAFNYVLGYSDFTTLYNGTPFNDYINNRFMNVDKLFSDDVTANIILINVPSQSTVNSQNFEIAIMSFYNKMGVTPPSNYRQVINARWESSGYCSYLLDDFRPRSYTVGDCNYVNQNGNIISGEITTTSTSNYYIRPLIKVSGNKLQNIFDTSIVAPTLIQTCIKIGDSYIDVSTGEIV